MRVYHNPVTGQCAIINSDKADASGNIWVEIDNALPTKVGYDWFVTHFKVIGERR